jgi:hypothetical protein|tara:strand:+ start:284 stop:649 length:366 start_codon:yes stop_codon:yes gene_type:complete
MNNYNWCHGPECHTQQTQSRVRGSGDNKVLRTRRIKQDNHYIRNSIFSYFCSNRCLFDYLNKHMQAIAAIAPRSKALETPIKVEKEKYESYKYDWNGNYQERPQRVPYMATRTTIKSVDNN